MTSKFPWGYPLRFELQPFCFLDPTMSSSPFEIFRRNLKPMMVLLTLLALFAFVVLPALDTYLRRGGGSNSDPVAAVYDGVTLTQSRVARTTQQHRAIVGFLSDLGQETIRRGGVPQVPGFQYDQESGQIQSLGIDANPSEEATINTMRFYSEARKAGFELDDTSVRNWLSRYTDGLLSDNEIGSMLMQFTKNQMGPIQLYEQLRMHLLSDLYQRSAMVGLMNGRMPVTTPLAQWRNFLKTNQSANIDAYGVLVAEYLDQTDESPSQSKIQEVYDAGKDLLAYPNDQSPEPKFRRPDSAEIEFVFADLNDFVEREKAKLTEEAIRAEYERRLAGGDFQMPVEATEDATAELEAMEIENAAEEAAEETAETTEEESPATETEETVAEEMVEETTEAEAETEPTSEESSETSSEEPPAEEPASEETPAEETTSEETTSEETTSEETTSEETTSEETGSEESTDEPANEDSSMLRSRDEAVQLVAFQDDDDAPETPADAPPATETSDDEMELGDGLDLGDEPAETKPQSFEDVRDAIATDMVSETARQKLDQTITEMNALMRDYFSEMAVHESNVAVGVSTAEEAPTRPDLKAIAEEKGLGYGTTGLVNRVSVSEEPIGESYGLGQSLQQRGAPYYAMMFGAAMQDGSSIPAQPAFAPQRSVDLENAKSYVSWKTKDIEAYTPELDEVREEVILAIRTEEARELAQAAARKLADSLTEGKQLADIVPEGKEDNLHTGLGPFSWLNMVGMMQTSIGNVPELNSVGDEFMRSVFNTEVGQANVAPNAPLSVYYVVQPTQFQPEMEQLREQFSQPQQRFMAQLIGDDGATNIVRGFFETINERTGFEIKLGEDR
ncbi:hypothetical protein RISK_006665 [Rhodopirellula islandica]|uniref:Transmembrane protein n=2 Tax=Rhodopirellula islandica TaxID=595434 RepID=A0A0J1E7Q1_RHOIS|nr:hypothetical protein RISK_006665 [Rhodopirellula islandica]